MNEKYYYKVYMNTHKGILKGKRKETYHSIYLGDTADQNLTDELIEVWKQNALKSIDDTFKTRPQDIELVMYPCRLENEFIETVTLIAKVRVKI